MRPVFGEHVVDVRELAAGGHDRGEIVEVFGAHGGLVEADAMPADERAAHHDRAAAYRVESVQEVSLDVAIGERAVGDTLGHVAEYARVRSGGGQAVVVPERGHLNGEPCRQGDVVGVESRDEFAARRIESRVGRGADALVAIEVDETDARVVAGGLPCGG